MRLSQKGLILVAVPLAFQLAFVGILSFLLRQADEKATRSIHSRTLSEHTNNLLALTDNAVNQFLKYSGAARNDNYYRGAVAVIDRIPSEADQIVELCKASPRQCRLTDELTEATGSMTSIIRQGLKLKQFEAMNNDNVQTTWRLNEECKNLCYALMVEETRFNVNNPREEEQLHEAIRLALWIGVILSVMVALCASYFFSRGITNRLDVVIDNTGRLTRQTALNAALPGSDEIAQLDRSFHTMAALLETAENERKRVDALKQQFLAMVSHDIRTPLTSVQGALVLLLTGALGEEKSQATLESALRNTERLIRLVSELLDLEKADAGELTITLTTTSLNTVVEQAVESVEVFAKDRGVVIRAEKTTATVLGDEKRLIQVLINLLSNAVKFSPEGSQVVVLVVEVDQWLEVRVTDQGRGIPENQLRSIFDRFKQVEYADASIKGGTGLGLAISKTIIEKHMGSIGVDSETGIGSTFWFRLPRC